MTASLPSGCSKFFSEDRCDPATVALIGHCVKNGIDMESELPLSDGLKHSLSECVIPLLSRLHYRDDLLRIKAETVAVGPDDTGEAVGTLLRSDVDSLHSIMHHYDGEALKLTHLVAVGGDPGADAEPWKGLGLKVIPVRTNLEDIAGCDAGLFEGLFAAFLLERLWYTFIMPQTSEKGGFGDEEKIALLLSSRALQLAVEGIGLRKLDKFKELSSAHRAFKDALCHHIGAPGGLMEALWAADASECLENFEDVLDIDGYAKNRLPNYVRLLESEETELTKEAKDELSKKGLAEYREAADIVAKVDAAIDDVYLQPDTRRAILKPYIDVSRKANRRYLRSLALSANEDEHQEGTRILRGSPVAEDRLTLIDVLNRSHKDEDRKEAVSLCKQMADDGDDRAMFMLGSMYLKGTTVGKDPAKAKQWLTESSLRGNTDAIAALAQSTSRSATKEDKASVFVICKRFADKDARIMALLGQLHLEGKGTPKDLQSAMRCFRRSSEMGSADAKLSLAKALMGSSDESERSEAFDLCSRLHEEGRNPNATYQLSLMYLRGIGVAPDLDKSVDLMNESLKDGDRISLFSDYIFALRKEILRRGYPRKYVSKYYWLLEGHGSWIGILAKFKDKPSFPHGILNIFISDSATIGKGCTILQNVTIGSSTVPGHERERAPTISDFVFIGAGANVIGDVSIGHHAVIAAGANVAKDVPPNSIVVCKAEILEGKNG